VGPPRGVTGVEGEAVEVSGTPTGSLAQVGGARCLPNEQRYRLPWH